MLSPYRVLDCSDGGAGLCGQILADLGADVVLIEPPGGAPSRARGPYFGDVPDPNRSLQFWATHRNKRSRVVDLESSSGRTAFRELLADSDVLIEDRPPGWLAERGLAPRELIDLHPGLVVVSISPFGQTGPKTHWAATDLTITAASGQLRMCGDDDRAPLASAVPQAWLHAGAEASVGTLLALAARERDGLGQHVDVSAQTAMMMATQSMVLCHGWNDGELARTGGGVQVGPIKLRFVYPCSDGFVNFTFLFGPALGPATARMFSWMHEEGFVDEATRDKDWIAYAALLFSGEEPISELDRATEAIERFTRAHTKAELYAGAFERRVLVVPLSDTKDVFDSRHLRARSFWTDLEHPELDTTVTYPGPLAQFSRTPLRCTRRPPLLGEHDDEPLRRNAASPSPASASSDGPLDGLKVLDFTWVYAGPAVTRYLTDYGAEVVRVESESRIDALRTGGPWKDSVPGIERSGGYANVNTGKLGLGLNMGVPEARELVLRLIEWADVVVENFSPRAMKAWGLDYAALAKRKPELIMLSTCLNGQSGPEATLAGYGTMGAAIAGFGFLTGWPDRAPSAPFLAYTDYVSPKFSTVALLAALEHRRRTGQGQHIDCAQAECCTHFLGPALLDYASNGRVWTARGNTHPDYAPSGVYPCAGNDEWIALAAPDEASWRALVDRVGSGLRDDARFATAESRLAHRDALDAEISAWTKGLEVAQLEALLQSAAIPAHGLSRSADCFADPQLEARGHFVWLEHPECGSVPLESSRIRLSRTPGGPSTPGPMIGQNNDYVLRELLGLDDDAMAALAIAGAIE